MKKGQKLWTREELILAINLYCKLPFGKLHSNNPEVIKLANLIGRTPGSVAYKLVNFASLDSSLKARGIKGAYNVSHLDKKIWQEFFNNWDILPFESEKLLAKFEHTTVEKLNNIPEEELPKEGRTKEQLIKVRVNQSFFRSTILASYDNACCVTGISITDMLIASHIIPWSKDEKNRLNPENGLCLNSFHDKAFDHGLITVDTEYNIRISKSVEKFKDNTNIQMFFYAFQGEKIKLPNRFLPNREFLKYHNERIFIK